MKISEIREELLELIKDNLSLLIEPVPIHSIGDELAEVAYWFQSLGICNLLIYADTDRFYENLIRSGHTRRYFLKKTQDEKGTLHYQCAISRWESLFDVLTAGDFGLAYDIISLSPTSWIQDGEYEDDFLYFYFLHSFLPRINAQVSKKIAVLQPISILKRWKDWLQDESNIRYRICQSFLSGDQRDFEELFETFIAARQEDILRESKMAISADICFEPRSKVFIEGLALLRIAKLFGFKVELEYPMCPLFAQLPVRYSFPQDIFLEIENHKTTL